MVKVLVTGGAGFIGSHLTEGLLKCGYQVVVLDNLCYGRREYVPTTAQFIEGDITDEKTCYAAMAEVEAVFHCAAMSRVSPSLLYIDEYTKTNILGTQNILMAARDNGVKKIIYSGSSTYYGNRTPPHYESLAPGDFLNFYALTKYVGEKYCLLFDEVFNLPCVILRYFNVYGQRQPEVGADALVLGVFLRRIAEGKALEIHGTGEQRRDFIHIKDVVAANIAALESKIRHDVFNVGSGKNISIKELANMLSSNQIHTENRKGDAGITLADITRIQALLHWQPTVSFEKGLHELLNATLMQEE